MRSTDAGRVRNGFESGDNESDNAWIHHTELDSEFRRAGFQRAGFSKPIAAEFGKHNFRGMPSGNRAERSATNAIRGSTTKDASGPLRPVFFQEKLPLSEVLSFFSGRKYRAGIKTNTPNEK